MFSASRDFRSLKPPNNKNGRSYSSGNSDRFIFSSYSSSSLAQ